MPRLDIRNLSVEFPTARGTFRAVDGLDLHVEEGEVLGIVGESGSGKSQSMLALMGLVAPPGRVVADALRFGDTDLLTLPSRRRRAMLGRDVAMIFQEPQTSLNPCYPVGWQVAEMLRAHPGAAPATRAERRARVVELFRAVGIPAPERRVRAFPHQMSGGMSQRVMIAMAIACRPALLLADEPTTALDVTVQKAILDLLVQLQRQHGMGLVLITHSMGVVAETAHRVLVMYAGWGVEEQPAARLFAAPLHPYTAALLEALPERADTHAATGGTQPRLPTIPGIVPGIADRPGGCVFHPRCRFATATCSAEAPPWVGPPGARARCHYPLDPAGRPTRGHPLSADAPAG